VLLAASDAVDPPDPSSMNNGYWFELDEEGAVASAGRIEPEGSIAIAVGADTAGRLVFAGKRDSVIPPDTSEVEVYFASQPGVWERRIAEPQGSTGSMSPRLDGVGPLAIVISDKGVVLAVNVAASATVGVTTTLELDPPMGRTHAAIMRINSRRGLECE
jgi:hypothetical protein